MFMKWIKSTRIIPLTLFIGFMSGFILALFPSWWLSAIVSIIFIIVCHFFMDTLKLFIKLSDEEL